MPIIDAQIRRELILQRFATSLVREYIRPTHQDLAREIPRMLVGWEEMSRVERTQVFADVRRLVRQRWFGIWEGMTPELLQLQQDELEATLELYEDFVEDEPLSVPDTRISTPQMLLETGRITQPGTWLQFTQRNRDETTRVVDGVLRRYARDGGTLQQLTTRLRGRYNRRTREYEGGVLSGQAKKAETLARTGVSHYTNAARDKFANANRNVLTTRIFFATLDSRTSDICFGNHLREWDLGDDNYPRLPLHFNERSVYIFRGERFNPLDTTRAAKGAEGVKRIQARTTADAWLRRQPREFVVQTLGRTRAELFLDGGMNLRNFISAANRPLTLEEIRGTLAGERAFRRAGL